MLARALAREPRLLVLDEPALMPNLGERDRFYALLRAAARERADGAARRLRGDGRAAGRRAC